jgi:hypothetical protein
VAADELEPLVVLPGRAALGDGKFGTRRKLLLHG